MKAIFCGESTMVARFRDGAADLLQVLIDGARNMIGIGPATAKVGVIVPLITIHLFMFYFGIMADVTPPVGLASFTAAAVAGGDAIKMGFVAFFHSLRTVALPFVFIFNTDLLLIDAGWAQGILVFISASIALTLIAFLLFRPNFFMDRFQPPFVDVEPSALVQAIDAAKTGSEIRVVVNGPNFDTSELRDFTILLAIGAEAPADRLSAMGLSLLSNDDALPLARAYVRFTTFQRLDRL